MPKKPSLPFFEILKVQCLRNLVECEGPGGLKRSGKTSGFISTEYDPIPTDWFRVMPKTPELLTIKQTMTINMLSLIHI